MFPAQAETRFIADFGEPVLRDITRIVGRAYPNAHQDSTDKYPDHVARDRYPIERRAQIENGLAQLPAKHVHLGFAPKTNKRDTSGFGQLMAGISVLTISKTDGPGLLPREADYRSTLCKINQLVLEGIGVQVPEAPAPNAIYGVVVHGPDDDNVARMGFVKALLPDASGKQVLRTIDLWPYWEEGQGRVVFPSAPITPVAPLLRPSAKPQEETGA